MAAMAGQPITTEDEARKSFTLSRQPSSSRLLVSQGFAQEGLILHFGKVWI